MNLVFLGVTKSTVNRFFSVGVSRLVNSCAPGVVDFLVIKLVTGVRAIEENS